MSAEQRDSRSTVPADERIRIGRPNPTAASSHRDGVLSRRPSPDSETREPPLSYEIERTQLRARIAALECALETSENHRQAVIDQYERLLADRDEQSESSLSASESQSRSLLSRLVDR